MVEYDENKSTGALIVETIAALMTAAFGMIAALAWNEAIKALVLKYYAANPDDQWVGLMVYAVIVTIIAVVCIILIGRALAKLKKAAAAHAAHKSKA